MVRRCATCDRRIKPVNRKTECKGCAALTRKILGRINSKAYYKRKHNLPTVDAFCSSRDIEMLFYAVAKCPAKSTYCNE